MGLELGGSAPQQGGLNLGGNAPQQGGLNLGGSAPQQGGLDLGRASAPVAPATGGAVGGGLQLSKGQKMDLTKGNPGLDNLKVGLGWDVNNMSGQSFDLDTQLFMLNAQKKVVSQAHVVFYNNLVSPDGAVRHNGDNRTGQGEGDDETISIKLSQISPDVERLVFTVTIDQAQAKGQNFGQVANAYIRVVNEASNEQICRFDLSEDYSTSISLVVAEAYRHNGEWKFGALGQGSTLDLAGLCVQYGAM